MSKWENGASKPRINTIRKLSEVLEVSVEDLLTCEYDAFNRERKDLFAMKRDIIKIAKNKMKELYGENPPIEIINRFKTEELMLARQRYNDIFKIQMPNITPHVCRHTYCSNQARAGMNPKTLQYLMGHSDIGVTMNTYTHLGLDDAKNEMIRLEELEQARKELDKTSGIKPMKQNMFKAI